MAYMRGTYYVFDTGPGVQIMVGYMIRPDDPDFPELADEPELIAEFDACKSEGKSLVLPHRVMDELAAKFWLQMSSEKKQRFLDDPKMAPYIRRSEIADETGEEY